MIYSESPTTDKDATGERRKLEEQEKGDEGRDSRHRCVSSPTYVFCFFVFLTTVTLMFIYK
jgi:hypothetical protein